jgi:hypothetical protein
MSNVNPFMNKTKTIIQAVKRLREVEELLEMEGLFEQLEKIGAWSPRHYTERLERGNVKLRALAERLSICAENLEKYTWHCNDQGCDCERCKLAIEQKELRAELDKLKEGAK